MTVAEVFSDTACRLGEGPLWHPERGQLFWFDILGQRLLTRVDGAERHWQFEDAVSAAGWVDRDRLLVAGATALFLFDVETDARDTVAPLEADNRATRSNDGRADPQGGFWIGTMGRKAEPGAGAIYRYHRGTLRRLVDRVTIPNAICFAPDGRTAFYTDTADGRILRQSLDRDGWPDGAPSVFVDLSDEDFGPDGAVVDAGGCLWNAQWGAGRVARYAPDGALLSAWPVPTPQASCPAFGGPQGTTLHVTTAADGVGTPPAGQTFRIETGIAGQREHRVAVQAR